MVQSHTHVLAILYLQAIVIVLIVRKRLGVAMRPLFSFLKMPFLSPEKSSTTSEWEIAGIWQGVAFVLIAAHNCLANLTLCQD